MCCRVQCVGRNVPPRPRHCVPATDRKKMWKAYILKVSREESEGPGIIATGVALIVRPAPVDVRRVAFALPVRCDNAMHAEHGLEHTLVAYDVDDAGARQREIPCQVPALPTNTPALPWVCPVANGLVVVLRAAAAMAERPVEVVEAVVPVFADDVAGHAFQNVPEREVRRRCTRDGRFHSPVHV